MESEKGPQPMYVVDVDERSGKALRGTRRSASTKPKLSQRRKSTKPGSDSGYSTGQLPGGDDASSPEVARGEVVSEKQSNKERRQSKSSPRKPDQLSPTSSPRLSHGDRSPSRTSIPRDDPIHYGVSSSARTAPPVITQPLAMRPRAVTTHSRPVSYHGAAPSYQASAYPPISNSAFWQQQGVIAAPSYPPPSSSFMQYAPPTQPNYFDARPPSRSLANRFEAPARTSSAYGTRDRPTQAPGESYKAYYDDGYAASEGASIRRSESTGIRVPSVMGKAQRDFIDMPPPPRPILRRPITEGAYIENGRPPLTEGAYTENGRELYRSSRAHDDEDAHQYGRDEFVPRSPLSRPSPRLTRNSVSDDLDVRAERARVEPANSNGRRQSYYGQSATGSHGLSTARSYGQPTGSSDWETKMREAESHQATIGGATAPLTADTLRRQQRAGSSRSTKSSGSRNGSRDESDYLKSATTRTTHSASSPDDENITITVTGEASVVVGGAQIDCHKGGAIEIKRRDSMRMCSEKSTSEYDGHGRVDDRRNKGDRQSRARLGSQHNYRRSPLPPLDNIGNFF